MNYLERNQKIITEISQNLIPQRSVMVEHHTKTRFTSIGYYNSPTLNIELHLGLKECMEYGNWLIKDRLVGELSLMRAIEEYFPDLVSKLPLVHGLVVDNEGRDQGIITEDFSKGGKNEVRDITEVYSNPEIEVPEISKLKRLIENPNIDESVLNSELPRVCFLVNGQIRLGDLYGMRMFLKDEDCLQRFRTIDLEREIAKYTLFLSHTI